MKLLLGFLLLVPVGNCLNIPISLSEDKHNTLQIKTLKCEANPQYVDPFYCHIKPTRNGRGLTTIKASPVTPLKDIWIHGLLSYKYSTIFRPWMIDVDFDLCGFLSGNFNAHQIILLAIKSAQNMFPVHGCPFNESLSVENLDIGLFFSQIWPQVIPEGEYKAMVRGHTRKNETIFIATGTGYFRAKDFRKTMKMG